MDTQTTFALSEESKLAKVLVFCARLCSKSKERLAWLARAVVVFLCYEEKRIRSVGSVRRHRECNA